MANRLRVVQVGKYYPPHVGGIETHLQALCNGLKVSHDVQVFVAGDRRRDVDTIVDGVAVHRLGIQFEIAGAPVCPTMPWKIRRAGADIVHIHLPNPAGVLALLASGYRGPLVATWHSDVVRQRRLAKMFEPVQRRFLANCDALIATSPNYVESSPDLSRLKKRTVVIPYGIAVEEFRDPPATASTIRSARSGPLLLAVGRLVYYKGFEYLIRAMKQIDATLLLIGDGPLLPSLQNLAQELGVASRIEFLGEMQPREVVPYYHAADLFVLPSIARSEAFGIVQLEAMACGKPVVNTNLASGVPFASRDGVTGITVEPGNADALASAVNRLLADPQLRSKYGEAARRRVQSEFTIDVMVQRISDLYDAVLDRQGVKSASDFYALPHRVDLLSRMRPPESNPPRARSPLRALTGLRFVAAFWVVLFHFFRPMKLGIPMPASLDSILESGFCGIGLFFALSGFVLSYVYGEIDPKDPIAKQNFWAARFARVYPIHIVGFVLAAPFVILHRMAKSSGLALLVKIVTAAAASLTLTQAWFWPLSRTWNGLAWTLSVEVFCYLLFPWIAAKLRTLRDRELVALAALMWICAMLPPAVWHFVPKLPEFLVLDDPLFHLPTFVAGAAVGFLFLRRKLSGAQASLCSVSGLAIILAVTAFSKSIAAGFLHNGFLIPGFCLLIYGLACDGWPASILSGRVMQLLGDASYSVYILQFCVWWTSFAFVTGFARIDYAAATNADVMAGSAWFFLVNSAILITLSILLFKYVETPARTYLRSKLSYHRPEASSYVPDPLRRADARSS